MNNTLPVVLLGILNLLVFVIPADAREKMSFAMTVFLSLGVFLLILSIQLPIDSDKTSLLEVYIVFQMTLGLWPSLFRLFNLSFTTGSPSRKSQSFQRFRPH